MDLMILRSTLVRWARFVIDGHRTSLGFTLPAYAEYVGRGAYAEYMVAVDPEVERVDRAIKLLPDNMRAILWLHYVEPGPVKSKFEPGQGRAYHARKLFAEESLLSILQRMDEESAAKRAAESATESAAN